MEINDFVGAYDERPFLRQPFYCCGYTCAGNGMSLIMVKNVFCNVSIESFGTSLAKGVTGYVSSIEDAVLKGDFKPLIPVPPPNVEKCYECDNGMAQHINYKTPSNNQSGKCSVCNGAGKTNLLAPVIIEGIPIAYRNYLLLSSGKNVQVAKSTNSILFKCDLGIGKVMGTT